MKNNIDAWANFLVHEKLHPRDLDEDWILVIIYLAEELAKKGRHKAYRPYKDRLAARKMVCETAIDLGIDLVEITNKKTKRRWVEDYWTFGTKARFGSNVGTNAEYEVRRRDIKTRLCKQGIKGISHWSNK